jgi:hypothetical protein
MMTYKNFAIASAIVGTFLHANALAQDESGAETNAETSATLQAARDAAIYGWRSAAPHNTASELMVSFDQRIKKLLDPMATPKPAKGPAVATAVAANTQKESPVPEMSAMRAEIEALKVEIKKLKEQLEAIKQEGER